MPGRRVDAPGRPIDQRTTTVPSIHGWIAQMNRCVPGVSVPGIVVSPPAATKADAGIG